MHPLHNYAYKSSLIDLAIAIVDDPVPLDLLHSRVGEGLIVSDSS